MFKSQSLTITALILGLLASIFPAHEAQSVTEGMTVIIEQLFVIVPILIAWFGRVRVGDISLFGMRK